MVGGTRPVVPDLPNSRYLYFSVENLYLYTCVPVRISNQPWLHIHLLCAAGRIANSSDLFVAYTAIRPSYISQLKTVVRAETFESWPSEKGVNSKWKTKKKICPCLTGLRLSQRYMPRFANCAEDFEARLWRHKSSVVTKHIYININIYIYMYHY